jgi:oligoendopeptidase F
MAEKIPERKDIPDKHQWDLSPLFTSEEHWHSLFEEIQKEIERYPSFKGRLSESVELFREAVEFDLFVSRTIDRLFTYAHLKSDQDTTNQHYLGMLQRIMNCATRASELSSYLTPEIQSVPDDVMASYLEDPVIQKLSFYLHKILRYKPHTLSHEGERVLALSGEMSHAASAVFGQLDNADLRFGFIADEKGNEVELSHGNFSSFLQSWTREIRKRAFFQYYEAYEAHKNSIAATLLYSNKKDVFYAKARGFKTCRTASLFSDNVPEDVYDNLIGAVKGHMGPLFKYLDFRKRTLGLDELHFYDTYVPLVKEIGFSMPYEEAAGVCVEACAVMGEEYAETLRRGLASGWVDRYENRGKRSGAYSSGCYDSPPYMLMNYKDDNINSLYTLIHESGHSMHSWYSNRNQAYAYHDYTIFVAEVASTFNEALLSAHLLGKYADNAGMRAYVLNREIDNIRATLFRQCMFAEFEKLTHREVEANRPLTLDVMREMYRGLLKDYFGGSMVVDEELTLECLRIPHFYSPFYVYKYATGVSAAIALAQGVLEQGTQARDAYLNFLSLGGSMFPLDELREAGVDMLRPQPIEGAIGYFSRLVDELMKAVG